MMKVKENKDRLFQLRMTEEERKRLEALSERTGQSYSELFRVQTLRLEIPLNELVKIVKVRIDENKKVIKRESQTG